MTKTPEQELKAAIESEVLDAITGHEEGQDLLVWEIEEEEAVPELKDGEEW